MCSLYLRALRGCERLHRAERNSQKLMRSGCILYLGVFLCVCVVLVYNIIITPPENAEIRERKPKIITING